MYMYMAFTHLVHKLFYKKTPIACEQIVVKGHVDITCMVGMYMIVVKLYLYTSIFSSPYLLLLLLLLLCFTTQMIIREVDVQRR